MDGHATSRIQIISYPFGGYVALPQLSDMGRLEGNEDPQEAESQDPENSKSAWDDFDDDEVEEEPQPILPKITYTDKMIVSVMGAVFNIILAFALSAILWFLVMMLRIPN